MQATAMERVIFEWPHTDAVSVGVFRAYEYPDYGNQNNVPAITRPGHALDDIRLLAELTSEELAEATGVDVAVIVAMGDKSGGWQPEVEPGFSDVARLASFFALPMVWITQFLDLPADYSDAGREPGYRRYRKGSAAAKAEPEKGATRLDTAPAAALPVSEIAAD